MIECIYLRTGAYFFVRFLCTNAAAAAKGASEKREAFSPLTLRSIPMNADAFFGDIFLKNGQ